MGKGDPIKPIIQSRRVQDPSLTDALYYAERERRPSDPHIGKVWVEENAVTRIGGLALIRRRLSHHERAAEWFKSAYEALYGGMAPAIDMAKVRVDTSIMAHDSGMVDRIDRADDLIDLIVGRRDRPPLLSKASTDRIVACVVLGEPASSFAIPGPSGKPSGHAVEREVDAVLAALDHVAELRGMKTRAA